MFFGQNVIHTREVGRITVGDAVRVLSTKPSAFEFAPGYAERMAPGSEEEKARIAEYGF